MVSDIACARLEVWQLVVIVLIPKTDGGQRPIGLLPAAIRLWMRARSPQLRRWEADNNPDGLYGGADRSAARAAWLAGFEGEAAQPRGCLLHSGPP